ncbi:MAG: hypothetical protein ACREC8_00430, partial [Limisphaerales bacterium]
MGSLFSCNLFADPAGIIERDGIEGLQFQTNAGNIILTWPSDSRESFAVSWRSNATIETPWVTLTNQLPAAVGTNETIFCDVGALTRVSAMRTNADLNNFYRVFVIPDFWFNLEGVTLNGDSQDGEKDFLPFYYGTKETDIFKPEVELLVDGQDEHFGEEDIQRVNFGSSKKPHWAYVAGFWFRHDLFANGEHTLQIRTLLTLNNVIGQWSQYLTLTNKPVHVWITNDFTFTNWDDLIWNHTNYTFKAQSTEPRVNWRIDVYDSSGRWLITKYGRTTTGDIRWTWNLRDAHGHSHDDPDTDRYFKPYLTVWPLNEPLKGGQLLMQHDVPHAWSDKLFGKTRNETPAKDHPSEKSVFSRPREFSHTPTNQTNLASHKMALELGLTKSFIQVTPAYSNAVLKTLLPYFSDFAGKLNLDIPLPITKNDVTDCRILPWHNNDGEIPNASIQTKEGLWFSFEYGHVSGFSWPNTYHGLQNPNEIPKYFGKVNMSKAQAIQLARETIRKLGISLEDVFAEQEPQVTMPEKIGTNTIARYFIKWRDPRGNGPGTVQIEINGETKQVESILFHAQNLERPAPKVTVIPPAGHGMFDSNIPPPVNPAYAWKLIPIMFAAIDDYARKLSLPIPRPLTTNNVARVAIYNNDGWPHAEITLNNGWRFVYRHTMVNGYYAPDNLFDSDNR